MQVTLPRPLTPAMAIAIADRFRLLAEPTRLRILDMLADGERSVGSMADELGCTQANVSKHLALLADAGIVGRRRDGLRTLYCVEDDAVFALCGQVCETLRRHADARAAALREP
jgi:DNA-binding transcriptional ArsR family regulator